MKTYKLTIAAVGALAFAVPALAEESPTPPAQTPTAQEQCRSLRADMNSTTFVATYGTRRNAFGKCVSSRAKATEAARAEARTNASKECTAAETADPVGFKAQYGTGKNGSNAHGKCVSTKARAKTNATVEDELAATVNAAKSCKAERKADAGAFATKYGTRRNAFGKCVSSTAKAQQDDEPADPAPAS